MKGNREFVFLCFLLNSLACQKDQSVENPVNEIMVSVQSEELILNPGGYAPLTAMIKLKTDPEVNLRIRVIGKNGPASDVVKDFSDFATAHEIPVLGLYPDYLNQIELTLTPRVGTKYIDTLNVQTASAIIDLPKIQVLKRELDQTAPGMTLVDYYGHNGEANPQRAFIFDHFGDIRWYLDYRGHPQLSNLFYDVGMKRLHNGHLFFGDRWTNIIYEIDMLGTVVESWPMPGFRFHHEVIEKPNGNFLVTANKIGLTTVEDHIVEIDRASKQIINVWDLRQSLDASRRTFTNDRKDWIHVNAVLFDSSDESIIITGRTQGVFKLSSSNELIWILNPHEGWKSSGNGTDLTKLLMQPLDAKGSPITDPAVLKGQSAHPEFDWPWYAHAPLIMPNGHLMVFDNGENRHFQNEDLYSRAVEYEINDESLTLKQIWTYGAERGKGGYSRIVSDVDYLQESNHLVYSLGAVVSNPPAHGLIVELDYKTKEIYFEVKIIPPQTVFNITFHRTERMFLYH